jgi:hypothetical protein
MALKITLPKKWASGPFSKLCTYCVDYHKVVPLLFFLALSLGWCCGGDGGEGIGGDARRVKGKDRIGTEKGKGEWVERRQNMHGFEDFFLAWREESILLYLSFLPHITEKIRR